MDTRKLRSISDLTNNSHSQVDDASLWPMMEPEKNIGTSRSTDSGAILEIGSGGLGTSEITHFPAKKRRSTGVVNETIKEWWVGKVTGINQSDEYFTATLYDPIRELNSVAEIEFSEAFDDEHSLQQQLFEGAEFAFYVFTKHGLGSPVTNIGIEFNTPYIWSDADDNKVEETFKNLFPYDK